MHENINKTIEFAPENTLLYNFFFLIMCNNQYPVFVKSKWINGEMNIYSIHFYIL